MSRGSHTPGLDSILMMKRDLSSLRCLNSAFLTLGPELSADHATLGGRKALFPAPIDCVEYDE